MKRCNYFFIVMGLVFFTVQPVLAQDEESVTDEELHKYAIVMDSIETMKENLMADITDMVQNNDALSASRYNELYKVIGDSAKLSEAGATAEEIAAVMKVQQLKNDGTQEINEAFQSLARDFLGAATYNKVKKGLSADGELKEKYQTILKQLSEEKSEGQQGDT